MRSTVAAALMATVLFLGGVGVWVAAQSADAEPQVRYDRESRYYRIRVVDYEKEGRRCLHFSKSRGIQSSMFLDDPYRLDLRYSKSMIAALALHPAPKDVLLVGLGGASIPKFINKHWPDIRLDIVEIDPDVVRVCQEWFAFKGAPGLRVIVMDGRIYLKRNPKAYDVILLDAYAADRVPFHLTTSEFIALAKSRLKPGGLVASNLWEHGVNRFYNAELKTFQATFPQTYLFKCGTSGNIIVFGALNEQRVAKMDWAKRAKALAEGRDLGLDLPRLVEAEYSVLTDRRIDEKPLTDDMAPVDTLRNEPPKHFDEGT
ncbi:MAG TPA: fused MFS/spermidine synthase [Phycisphaerae bacterium]|nr:fused MFS/spermidine synthase [Phycisphaerae bacterium]